MATFVGYVGEAPSGATRIYLVEDPSRFVDVAPDDLEAVSTTEVDLVGSMTVREGADVVHGTLERKAFAELFESDATAKPYKTFYCTTKFWKCQYSKSPC